MIQLFIYELSKLDEFMFGQYCLKSMNDSIFFSKLGFGQIFQTLYRCPAKRN